MGDLSEAISIAVDELCDAKLLVREKERTLADLIATGGGITREQRQSTRHAKREIAIKNKIANDDPVPPTRTGPRSDTKQKIIEALRASGRPLSIALIAERAGCSTTNAYYHLTNLRQEGAVRLLEDGYELLVASEKKAAA